MTDSTKEGVGTPAPSFSLPIEERQKLAQEEIRQYLQTGIEPDIPPVDAKPGNKLFRCQNCGTLVWQHDKAKITTEHLGHRLALAIGGSPEEAIRLKYDLI